jgi:hypothetical protein
VDVFMALVARRARELVGLLIDPMILKNFEIIRPDVDMGGRVFMVVL